MKLLYSIYAWLLGGLIFIFTMIIILILHPILKTEQLFYFTRFSFKLMLKILFIRIKVIYEEPIDKSKTYIFMPNHVSLMDVLFATAYAPVFYNAIEAHTHFRWFMYGKVIKILGQIPINRKNPKSSLKSFEIAKQRLKQGRSIIVFPEGTRSRTGKLGKFKTMPFTFALEAQADIVPTAILGNDNLIPEKSLLLKPSKITIVFGKHLKHNEIKNLSDEQLKDKTKQIIQEMKNKYQN